MNQLPIVHMTLYKHGVGYFQRRGTITGEAIKLIFRREEMADLLKSLTVIDHGGGQVLGVDYDTPQNRQERLAGCSVILDDRRSLRDLMMALRGRKVQLLVSDGSSVEGLLLGLDEDNEQPLVRSLVSVLRQDTQTVAVLSISRIEGVELHDETAASDLRFFLQTALGHETHRSITIRLSPGDHDLEVGYIAPAPTWRVSYRLVVDHPGSDSQNSHKPQALLQGWGVFDNRLEEDLNGVSLSLTAGMPISFVYDLYTPRTPRRPVVEEEARVAAGPVMFEAVADEEVVRPPAPAAAAPLAAKARPMAATGRTMMHQAAAETMAASAPSAATGQAMGELFQYNVSAPVTVGRGQSAMVPIVSSELAFKKDLIYNGAKMPTHPVATLRFKNQTGLTLERGPVTVLDYSSNKAAAPRGFAGGRAEYVGEAILSFTADKAEAVISYAVELGVHVKEEVKTESQLQSLQVKDGYLLQNLYDIRRTIYRIDNRTAQSKTVLIEHNVGGNYSVFNTPKPLEKTLNTYRYRVKAVPHKITLFTVQERYLHARREELRNLSYQGLQQYFENKFLNKQTYAGLKALLDTWAEIDRLQREINGQEQHRAKIYAAQEQAQKNMAVLSNEGEEGRLRGRYVQQLTQSEEQLAQIDQAVARLQAEIGQKQAQIEKMIAALGTGKR